MPWLFAAGAVVVCSGLLTYVLCRAAAIPTPHPDGDDELDELDDYADMQAIEQFRTTGARDNIIRFHLPDV